MKKIKYASLFLIFIFLILAQKLLAQQSQNFYPLHVGNIWVYEVWFQGQFNGYDTVRVVKDTVMPNGKSYTVVLGRWRGTERISDSLATFKYDQLDEDHDTATTELLLERFNAQVGETWRTFKYANEAKMLSSYQTVLFGDTAVVKVIEYTVQPSGLFAARNHYSRVHGLIYSAEEGGASYTLVGARINGVAYGTLTSVPYVTPVAPKTAALKNPFPNPFNSTTTIEYDLNQPSPVSIKVYDALGRFVKTLLEVEEGNAGRYRMIWNLTDKFENQLPSGTYFIRFYAGKASYVKKVIAIR